MQGFDAQFDIGDARVSAAQFVGRGGLGNTPSAHQVNHQYNQGNHQQQMNQTSSHVEAETEKPQNQKHNENCPKHVDLLRSIEGLQELIYSQSCRSIISPIRSEPAISRTPGTMSWIAT
jgi:hypothetical protein